MTEMATSSGAPKTNTATWKSIYWKQAEVEVCRLQMRIAKAFHSMKASEMLGHHGWPYQGLSAVLGKLACCVLRGLGSGNGGWLLDNLAVGMSAKSNS